MFADTDSSPSDQPSQDQPVTDTAAHSDEQTAAAGTAAAGQQDASSINELDALKEELKKMRDIAGRAQAELQNAKTRLEREAMEMRMYATETVMHKILPTLDNFSRAFAHVPEELKDHEWVKGIAVVEQELMRCLTELGLQRMESLGARVDPAKHEVLMTGPGEEGTVVEVFEEGYMLGDKVIRPAKVKAGA